MPWHVLKPNHTSERPQSLLFLDTETTQLLSNRKKDCVEHVFKLAVACHVYHHDGRVTENWCHATSLEQLWDFMYNASKKQKKLYVFAHNFNFDFFIINGFGFLKRYGYTIVKHVVDSQRFIIFARNQFGSIVFVDTGNYARFSLAEIGKQLGLPKLTVDFEKTSVDELFTYCHRDVKILKRFIMGLLDFIQQHDLGCFKPTLAGLAFTAYRHRFMHTPIFIHEHSKARMLEQQAYHGGRCEAFYIGKPQGNVYYKLDVNSMYPYVMSVFKYPVKLVSHVEHGNLNGLRRALKKYLVIADVEAEIGEPAIGVKIDKLVFPVGRFRACLTSPELEYILQNGKLHKVIAYNLYESGNIFTEYVKYFYNLKNKYKADGNRLYYFLVKLYLNSLYGKFGQQVKKFTKLSQSVDLPDGIHDIIYPENGERQTLWVLNGDTWEVSGFEYGRDSMVAIPAFVTAYARMYLWQLIKTAGIGNVYYCDTDSLIVNQAGYINLQKYLDEERLGALKCEGKTSKLVILGAKRYQFGDSIHVKGVKGLVSNIYQESFEQERWYKARTLLRLGVTDKVLIEYYTKHLKTLYDKGIVTSSGVVKPLVVNVNAID